MKYIPYIMMLLLFSGVYAQNNNEDEMKSVEIAKNKMIQNGSEMETKVKVVTEKEEDVLVDFEKEGVNRDRLNAATKVTKTIYVDNDWDGSYDSETKLEYYSFNGKRFGFESVNDGYIISRYNNNSSQLFGKALKSSIDDVYYLKLNDFTGMGYFDKDGNLHIEYFDLVTEELRKMVFEKNSF